jgi:hypothetical protein
MLFNRGEWAVVMLTTGDARFGEDNRKHEAIAVAHWPQSNAATIKVGLSEKAARREAARLNQLNSPILRAQRIQDFISEVCT